MESVSGEGDEMPENLLDISDESIKCNEENQTKPKEDNEQTQNGQQQSQTTTEAAAEEEKEEVTNKPEEQQPASAPPEEGKQEETDKTPLPEDQTEPEKPAGDETEDKAATDEVKPADTAAKEAEEPEMKEEPEPEESAQKESAEEKKDDSVECENEADIEAQLAILSGLNWDEFQVVDEYDATKPISPPPKPQRPRPARRSDNSNRSGRRDTNGSKRDDKPAKKADPKPKIARFPSMPTEAVSSGDEIDDVEEREGKTKKVVKVEETKVEEAKAEVAKVEEKVAEEPKPEPSEEPKAEQKEPEPKATIEKKPEKKEETKPKVETKAKAEIKPKAENKAKAETKPKVDKKPDPKPKPSPAKAPKPKPSPAKPKPEPPKTAKKTPSTPPKPKHKYQSAAMHKKSSGEDSILADLKKAISRSPSKSKDKPKMEAKTEKKKEEEPKKEAKAETEARKEPLPMIKSFVESLQRLEYDVKKYTCFYCVPCHSFLTTTALWEEHLSKQSHKNGINRWRQCMELKDETKEGHAHKQHAVDRVSKLVIGADHMVEVCDPKGDPRCWVCLMCHVVCDDAIEHLGDITHIDNYMEFVEPSLYRPPGQNDKKTNDCVRVMSVEWEKHLIEEAKYHAKKKGVGKMQVYHGEGFTEWPGGESSEDNADLELVEQNYVMERMEELFEDDTGKNYKFTYKVLPSTRSLANVEFNKMTTDRKDTNSYIGMQYIMEIWPPSRRVTAVYYCRLCDYMVTNWAIHCTILKHCVAYLAKHYDSVYDAVLCQSESEDECRRALTLAREKVTALEGRQARVTHVVQLLAESQEAFVAVNANIAKRIGKKENFQVPPPERKAKKQSGKESKPAAPVKRTATESSRDDRPTDKRRSSSQKGKEDPRPKTVRKERDIDRRPPPPRRSPPRRPSPRRSPPRRSPPRRHSPPRRRIASSSHRRSDDRPIDFHRREERRDRPPPRRSPSPPRDRDHRPMGHRVEERKRYYDEGSHRDEGKRPRIVEPRQQAPSSHPIPLLSQSWKPPVSRSSLVSPPQPLIAPRSQRIHTYEDRGQAQGSRVLLTSSELQTLESMLSNVGITMDRPLTMQDLDLVREKLGSENVDMLIENMRQMGNGFGQAQAPVQVVDYGHGQPGDDRADEDRRNSRRRRRSPGRQAAGSYSPLYQEQVVQPVPSALPEALAQQQMQQQLSMPPPLLVQNPPSLLAGLGAQNQLQQLLSTQLLANNLGQQINPQLLAALQVQQNPPRFI